MIRVSEKTVEDILNRLDKSIRELADGAIASPEFQSNFEEVQNFLSSQYEIRLQNMLKTNNSDIHHLESGIKNKIIQRKQKLFENISKLFQS
jgi:hypothetical protein